MARTTTSPELSPTRMGIVHAVRAAYLLRIVAHRLLHRQGGIAGPNRMILMRQRGAEQRHDAVAQDLIDRAFVAVHRRHHPLEHRVEELLRFLGVAIGEQLHRAFEVGKEHGDLFAFAFERTAGGQDLLGEVWWRVGQRRAFLVWRGWGDGDRGRGEVAGPHQPPARFIGDLLMSKEERVFQVFQRRLIELELPLEGPIGQAAPLAQQDDHLIHDRDKVHPLSSLPGARPPCPCASSIIA